jgi:hypothetical protein
VLAVSWIAFGAILLSPLRSGEIVRPYLVTRSSNIRIWEATGTVGAERIIGVGILVPAGPGFFGAFQLSTYMALAMYFPEATSWARSERPTPAPVTV